MIYCKAYIPLQLKIPGVGGWRLAMAPMPEFCVWDTNRLVSCSQRKPLNLRHPKRQTLKFALPPTPTPDACQWNIGGVGPSGVATGVGHVHFMFFVFCSQRKPSFQWNMGLSVHIFALSNFHASSPRRHVGMVKFPCTYHSMSSLMT